MTAVGYYIEFIFWLVTWISTATLGALQIQHHENPDRYQKQVRFSQTSNIRACTCKILAILATFPNFIKHIDPMNRTSVCINIYIL